MRWHVVPKRRCRVSGDVEARVDEGAGGGPGNRRGDAAESSHGHSTAPLVDS